MAALAIFRANNNSGTLVGMLIEVETWNAERVYTRSDGRQGHD